MRRWDQERLVVEFACMLDGMSLAVLDQLLIWLSIRSGYQQNVYFDSGL
jgi:hypothetical protein